MQCINYGQVQSINQLLPSSDVTIRVEFSDLSCGITGDVQAKTVPALTAAMATESGKSHRKWISNSHRKDSLLTLTNSGGHELSEFTRLPNSALLQRIVEHGVRSIGVTVLSAHRLQRSTRRRCPLQLFHSLNKVIDKDTSGNHSQPARTPP